MNWPEVIAALVTGALLVRYQAWWQKGKPAPGEER